MRSSNSTSPPVRARSNSSTSCRPGRTSSCGARFPASASCRSFHVTGVESIEQAERAAEHVHAVLLDSGNPDLKVKELGGTGRRHDWTVSARIRERLDVPVLLSSGLTPDNAAEALATVRPHALDVCTGLRDPSFALDPGKLARFAAAITAAALVQN